jgi:hypothetical protein
MRVFEALPANELVHLLDSEYHPRVVGDTAAKKSATSQQTAGRTPEPVAKEGAEPR